MRHVAVLPIRREVVVRRHAEMPELAPLEVGAQPVALGGAEIQNRDMRTLGRQHHALEAKIGGLIDELVKGEAGLSPGAGIADGM